LQLIGFSDFFAPYLAFLWLGALPIFKVIVEKVKKITNFGDRMS